MTKRVENPNKRSMLGRTHPARDLQTFDDPQIDHMFDILRQRRINLKKSQKEIAADANISRRAIQFMENHQHMPTLAQFMRYASALNYVVILTEAR